MAHNRPVPGPIAQPEPDAAQLEPDGTRRVDGFFEPVAGVRLYRCEWWPAPAAPGSTAAVPGALVVLMHGFAEHCRRYDELSEYLLGQAIAVCRFDARGHGRSSGQRGYIRRYEDYVEDLCAYVQRVSALEPQRPLALLGHSNGGLIAIRALQGGLAGVSALVLTNPLLRLRDARRPVPDGLARLLSWGAGRLPLPNGIRPGDLTHEPGLQEAVRRDRWVHRAATPRWYWSATLAGRLALAEAAKLVLPLLVVVGELDPVVEPRAVQDFYEHSASRDKQLVTRRGEYHEVLNETDRRSLFELLAAWLEPLTARGRPMPRL